jgi:hypothetical protein
MKMKNIIKSLKESSGKEIAAAIASFGFLIYMVITIILDWFFPAHYLAAFNGFIGTVLADLFVWGFLGFMFITIIAVIYALMILSR